MEYKWWVALLVTIIILIFMIIYFVRDRNALFLAGVRYLGCHNVSNDVTRKDDKSYMYMAGTADVTSLAEFVVVARKAGADIIAIRNYNPSGDYKNKSIGYYGKSAEVNHAAPLVEGCSRPDKCSGATPGVGEMYGMVGCWSSGDVSAVFSI